MGTLLWLCCSAAGNNVRLQRELDQAQAAPAPFNFQKLDADRLQSVYYSYDNLSPGDQASNSYSPRTDYGPSSSHSPGSRPSSARRTSRQQLASGPSQSTGAGAAGSIGVRPGSSAARRTKELLNQAGVGGPVLQGGSTSPSGQRSRPVSSALQGGGPGSLRGQWGQPGSGGSLLSGMADQPVVPKARGLVRGSTDALQLNSRPASRGL